MQTDPSFPGFDLGCVTNPSPATLTSQITNHKRRCCNRRKRIMNHKAGITKRKRRCCSRGITNHKSQITRRFFPASNRDPSPITLPRPTDPPLPLPLPPPPLPPAKRPPPFPPWATLIHSPDFRLRRSCTPPLRRPRRCNGSGARPACRLRTHKTAQAGPLKDSPCNACFAV